MSRSMLRLTILTIVAVAALDNYYSALPRPGADHGIIVGHGCDRRFGQPMQL